MQFLSINDKVCRRIVIGNIGWDSTEIMNVRSVLEEWENHNVVYFKKDLELCIHNGIEINAQGFNSICAGVLGESTENENVVLNHTIDSCL